MANKRQVKKNLKKYGKKTKGKHKRNQLPKSVGTLPQFPRRAMMLGAVPRPTDFI